MEEILIQWWQRLVGVINYPIRFGGIQLSVLTILELFVLLALVVVVEWFLRRYFTLRLLRHTRLSPGLQFGIARIAGYLFIALGFYIALQQTGLDLSSLAVFAGAVGVGLGFGLQNVISNFVSGIIILAERPISIGDRVEVAGVAGQVRQISLRSTIIVTNDNISIIVPNSEFISHPITNWSHGDTKVRVRVPVGVAYGSDIEALRRVMIQVAEDHPGVMRQPPPQLLFVGFGESSLDFELAVWTVDMAMNPRRFRSDLNYGIERALRQAEIAIPFPQRDLHLRSSDVPIAGGQGRGAGMG